MPWSEGTAVTERFRFVEAYGGGCYSMTELCERFGVSRKTGYKLLERYEQEGPEGLQDRSRAPHRCPQRTSGEIANRLVQARREHPYWGPKKLVRVLSQQCPELSWPAPSTAGAILKLHGLTQSRRRRRAIEHPGRSRLQALAPNDLWTTDFKGQFKTRDSVYCYPLTIADGFSRYLLGCEALARPTTQATRQSFERVFRTYGLPQAIRSDNGSPFASPAIGRLSKLSVWWIRLGILPDLIQPAHPEQNGVHERMHRTLKQETTRPPGADRNEQQKRFDHFRAEFNQLRPHEALHQQTPTRLYTCSPHSYPSRLPQLHYPGHYEVRLVGSSGCFSWKSHPVHLTSALTDQHVGLEEVDDAIWSLFFGPVLLGRWDERSGRLLGAHPC